jgi:CysZ protein
MMLIALAPLFAILSSKVQTIDSGHPKASCASKYLLDCSRGIKIALRNFVIEIVLSTLIIAISLVIAWVIPLAPIAILLLESYFMGYSMADYRNEYYGLKSRESRKLINNYFGLVLGNGFLFNILLLIPLLGILFAPTFALVSSGLSINYLEKRKSIICNSDQSTLLMAKS